MINVSLNSSNLIILLLHAEEYKRLEVATSKLEDELEQAKHVLWDKNQQISSLKEERQATQEKLAAHREEIIEQQERISGMKQVHLAGPLNACLLLCTNVCTEYFKRGVAYYCQFSLRYPMHDRSKMISPF